VPWTALVDTQAPPFARANNVTFDGTVWTRDISHGEMIRNGTGQTLTIGLYNLRSVHQGMDPGATDPTTSCPDDSAS
jgi:endo-1,4-beta-xylanase